MIWLASFPRSGNTFFRNTLFEVYGIPSSEYHMESDKEVEADFENFPVIKTHLLPEQLPQHLQSAKSVYLVRDGRDSLISLAHHRKNFLELDSDFYNNLLEAILSPGDSNFGGWSKNVEKWTSIADVVVKFENLVARPIEEIQGIKSIYDLPAPDISKLPSFEKLKFGSPKYAPQRRHASNALFFRKGKSGNWKEEMPDELHQLFWDVHRPTMQKLDYTEDQLPETNLKPYKILIDATKLRQPQKDGIKRYVEELVGAMLYVNVAQQHFEIDLFVGWGVVVPLKLNKEKEDKPSPNRLYPIFKKLLEVRRKLGERFSGGDGDGFSKFLAKMPLVDTFNRVYQNMAETLPNKRLDQYDLIHVVLPQHAPFYKKSKIPMVVTVHDLSHRLFEDFHKKENVERAEQGIQIAENQKANYIAVSKATQKDLINLYNIPKDRTTLIHEAVQHNFFKQTESSSAFNIIREKYQLPDVPYLMCLSTIEPRKNLEATIRAFAKLESEVATPLAMVICGAKGWKYTEIFEGVKDAQNIHFTGYVEENELPTLYANAMAFCYVSHYEGFGLPLLEAMSCGTAVIFGDNSSMPEVVGKGGLAAQANDIQDIFEKMKMMVTEDDLRNTLSKEARKQAFRFSWLRAAFETLNFYKTVIKQHTHEDSHIS